jgi:hypothetical protein
MGALYFASYGLANWLASRRTEVPFFSFVCKQGASKPGARDSFIDGACTAPLSARNQRISL